MGIFADFGRVICIMVKKVGLVLLCVLAVSCVSVEKQDTGIQDSPGDRELNPAPVVEKGFLYAVLEDGRVISGNARGSGGGKLFYLGNISKLYTAAAVMILAERGLIDLDSPVVSYIPEFRMRDSRYARITPRMLLSHRSGLYGSNRKNAVTYHESSPISRDAFLSYVSSQNLLAEPGAIASFSNDGFSLLEILVEKTSGSDFKSFLRTNIFLPLDLESTGFSGDASGGASWIYNTPVPEIYNNSGADGMYSNIRELGIFSRVLAGKMPNVLSEKSARAMMAEMVPDSGGYSGLGWDCIYPGGFSGANVPVLSQSNLAGYGAALVLAPDYGLAVIVNSTEPGSPGTEKTGNLASGILLDFLRNRNHPGIASADTIHRTILPLPDDTKDFEGTFYHITRGLVTIQRSGDRLVLLDKTGNTLDTLLFTGDGSFTGGLPGQERAYTFKALENGTVFLYEHEEISRRDSVYVTAQKLTPRPVPEDYLDVWERRNDQRYYVVDDHPYSKSYRDSPFYLSADMSLGYAGGARILTRNTAEYTLPSPSGGWARSGIEFFSSGKTEYLKLGGLSWIGENSMPSLKRLHSNVVIIPGDGFAQWFLIDPSFAGKRMSVGIPRGASFAVLDKNDVCIEFSAVNQESSADLPEHGKIAFIGRPGDTFTFSVK